MVLTRKEKNANYRAARHARGDRQVSVWLSVEARMALEGLAAAQGLSKDQALDRLLRDIPALPE